MSKVERFDGSKKKYLAIKSLVKQKKRKKHISDNERSSNKKSSGIGFGLNVMARPMEPPRLVCTLEPYIIGEKFEHYLERIKKLYSMESLHSF